MTYVLIIWLYVGNNAYPTQVEFGVHAEACETARREVTEKLHSVVHPAIAICLQK